MSKAIQIHENGGPEKMRLEEVEVYTIGDEVDAARVGPAGHIVVTEPG